MNLTIPRAALLDLVTKCASVADPKSSMPILGNVRLTTTGTVLVAEATDLYASITSGAQCTAVESTGSLAVSAKSLRELVARLPDGEVTLSRDTFSLTVKAGRSRYRLPTASADDMPPIPQAPSASVEVSARALLGALSAVSSAMSDDETRPHLAGVLVELDGKVVRAVATDGHRLHLREAASAHPLTAASMLLPIVAVREITRMAKESVDASLFVAADAGRVFVSHDSTTFAAVLPQETFPPYAKVIPKSHAMAFRCAKDALGDALKRLGRLATGIRFQASEGTLKLYAENPDVGEGVEEIDCDATSEGPTIGVNPTYLAQAIAGVSGDEVEVRTSGELDPVVVIGEGYTAVCMPMRV